jgi:hypothetical protein
VGVFVLKSKNLSLLVLVALFTVMIGTSAKSFAQDDMPNDEETIMPSGNAGAPPVIIDESDSGAVNDVEEYDG